ncbi:MAG: GAF domain-containing protein [Chloroflexia bacterium]
MTGMVWLDGAGHGPLEELLVQVCRQLAESLRASRCVLSRWTREEGTVSTWAWYGEDAATTSSGAGPQTYLLSDYPATARVLAERRPVAVSVDDPEADPAERALLQSLGQRAVLLLPLGLGVTVFGLLEVYRREGPLEFTPDEIALASALAAQAAIAIENARLYEESQRRLEEMRAVFEVGKALVSSLELQEVLQRICLESTRLFGVTSAYVARWDEDKGAYTVIAEYIGPEASPLEQISDLGVVYPARAHLSERLRQGLPYVMRLSDPRLPAEERRYLEQYDGKSVLVLPLVARGKCLGFIEVWESRQERSFTEEEIHLGQNLASQAAIAIENAQLYTIVQDQLRQLQEAMENQARLLETVREMSSPVVPIHDHVLVLPLIGLVDSERAQRFTEALLEAIQRQRARVVLLDITGVPVVDTAVAQALVRAAEAGRLLGAEVVLVGMRPEVAQTLVTLGVSLGGLVTRANLQAGVEYALGRLGLRIVPDPRISGRPVLSA